MLLVMDIPWIIFVQEVWLFFASNVKMLRGIMFINKRRGELFSFKTHSQQTSQDKVDHERVITLQWWGSRAKGWH